MGKGRELNVPDRGPKREVTVEEAAKCPRCGVLGRVDTSSPFTDADGKKWDVTLYKCVTETCTWFDTGWTVQSDDRGVVFQRDQGPRGQDKKFEPMSPDQISRGRRVLEDVINADAESVKSNPANKQPDDS